MSKLRNRLAVSLAFAAFVYIGFAVWSNLGSLGVALQQLQWHYVPLILLLTLGSYLFRFWNWQFYLKTLGIQIETKRSLLIYVAGFSMGITPGKVGEIIRAFLIKEETGTSLAKTAPILLVDRLTDVLALVIIALIGAMGFHYNQAIIWYIGLLLILIIAIVTWRSLSERLLRFFQGIGPLKKYASRLSDLYEASYSLLVPRRLFIILAVSVLGWSFEAVGFFVTLKALGIAANLEAAFFIYSFATIIGAVSFLPGGLGLTEGSMAGLLLALNIGRGQAAAATIIIRACTLWFGVILGSVVLLRYFHKLPEGDELLARSVARH